MAEKLTPKGMRDFLPEEMLVREQVVERITQVYRNYGFVPIDTPALEYLSTLKAKSGDEIAGQIFKFEGDDTGLRFDLTVPLARVAANNAFAKPFKRYCISKVWRKEEPQKGRFREFLQADVDIVGCRSMRAEAELLMVANDALLALGFQKPKFLINNRKLLDAIAEKLGFEDKKELVFRLLDKVEKLGEPKIRADVEELLGKENSEELFKLLLAKGSNSEKIKYAKKISDGAAAELEQIIRGSSGLDVEIDFFLVRGLGYYTGPVFEIKLSDDIGSVGGGGRYDNLLGIYGQADYATGISLGIERIMYLIGQQKSEAKKTYTKVFVASTKEGFEYSVKVASEFRKAGIPCEVDLNERNLRKQFDYANALGIRYVAIAGEKEEKEKKITLRNMESGKEELITVSDAVKKVEA